MNTNTRATSTIFVLLVVATTSFLFVASGTMTGLAASSDPSHGSKTGDQSRTNNSVSESGNHKINSPSFTTTNENPNLDTLLACESGAANGSGHLTMSEVMNCYLQFSRGSASSMAVLGDNQNSDGTGGGAGLGLTSDHHDKTTTHSTSHHKHAADSISPSLNRTTTD